ncbi:MAG: GGDEF domain-containing protein [Nitrosospira sp.]
MDKRFSMLVVYGFSVLLILGLGMSFFLHQKLQESVDAAAAATLLLDQTRVRLRDAQVDFLIMAQQVADVLLDPTPGIAFGEKNSRRQYAFDNAVLDTSAALAATQNEELKKTLEKLIDHAREIMLPLGDKIIFLAITDLDASKAFYWRKYIPAQAANMALIDDAIRLSSNELRRFSEQANQTTAEAQFISRIVLFLFACLGFAIAIFVGKALIHLEQELRLKAAHDSLTGLFNHGTIIDILRKAVARHERNAYPLSIIFADLDHFKQTNDNYGHQAGDEVLREVAQRGKHVLRPYDSFGRYGGEEFVIVLPDCGATGAMAIAERIRFAIADEPIVTASGAIHTTLSLGVAVSDGKTPVHFFDLIRRADGALYEAKEKGRNRVVCVDENSLNHVLPLPALFPDEERANLVRGRMTSAQ